MVETTKDNTHSLISSSFPVLLPYFKELYVSEAEFSQYIEALLSPSRLKMETTATKWKSDSKEETARKKKVQTDEKADAPRSAFMNALTTTSDKLQNMMRTENADVAYRSTESALVDLFFVVEPLQMAMTSSL